MRKVQIPVLPDGRVRIHFFVRDEAGPAKTPATVVLAGQYGPLAVGGTRGFLACRPASDRVLAWRGPDGIIRVPHHSDDPRAATCPECLKSEAYREAMAVYEQPDPEPPPKTLREYVERMAGRGDATAAGLLAETGAPNEKA